jgi:two-component system, cell cycle sensor histidine kinase and response regulator CckA
MASALGMQSILVVEDEPTILRLVSLMLETKGYRVLAAAGGEQALRIFAEDPEVDLLLTDVVAPGMSGPMIADQITAQRPGIKVLFMTGYDATHVVQRYVVEQGCSLIRKPFTLDQLLTKISTVLEDGPQPVRKEGGVAV